MEWLGSGEDQQVEAAVLATLRGAQLCWCIGGRGQLGFGAQLCWWRRAAPFGPDLGSNGLRRALLVGGANG